MNFEIDIADDDDLEVLDLVEYGVPRQIYLRQNYFDELNAVTFRKRFRLTTLFCRFPILAYGCRLKIETVQTVIVAATILHNIAIPDELEEHILNGLIENGQIPDAYTINNNVAGAGMVVRQQLINEYFTRF